MRSTSPATPHPVDCHPVDQFLRPSLYLVVPRLQVPSLVQLYDHCHTNPKVLVWRTSLKPFKVFRLPLHLLSMSRRRMVTRVRGQSNSLLRRSPPRRVFQKLRGTTLTQNPLRQVIQCMAMMLRWILYVLGAVILRSVDPNKEYSSPSWSLYQVICTYTQSVSLALCAISVSMDPSASFKFPIRRKTIWSFPIPSVFHWYPSVAHCRNKTHPLGLLRRNVRSGRMTTLRSNALQNPSLRSTFQTIPLNHACLLLNQGPLHATNLRMQAGQSRALAYLRQITASNQHYVLPLQPRHLPSLIQPQASLLAPLWVSVPKATYPGPVVMVG